MGDRIIGQHPPPPPSSPHGSATASCASAPTRGCAETTLLTAASRCSPACTPHNPRYTSPILSCVLLCQEIAGWGYGCDRDPWGVHMSRSTQGKYCLHMLFDKRGAGNQERDRLQQRGRVRVCVCVWGGGGRKEPLPGAGRGAGGKTQTQQDLCRADGLAGTLTGNATPRDSVC